MIQFKFRTIAEWSEVYNMLFDRCAVYDSQSVKTISTRPEEAAAVVEYCNNNRINYHIA